MATGFNSAVADEILDAMFNASATTILPVTTVWARDGSNRDRVMPLTIQIVAQVPTP